jgi:hypothetical protein
MVARSAGGKKAVAHLSSPGTAVRRTAFFERLCPGDLA